jgi:uncharacterized membrane protein
MNKLLVAVFDTEAAADAGLNALRALHTAGDITLYATGVLVRGADGTVSVRQTRGTGPIGTVSGLALGSLIGLLGGPAGVAIGAATGTVAGAIRDFWTAGVGLDFIEVALQHLKPGKVALVAEVEEEWVVPIDAALEAAGGQVFRRSRTEVAAAHFDHDIAAIRAELASLESEASHATGVAKTRLQTRLATTKAGLDAAVHRAEQRLDALKEDATSKAQALKLQLDHAEGEAKARIDDRLKRIKAGQHARGAKLGQAWHLTKEALTP